MVSRAQARGASLRRAVAALALGLALSCATGTPAARADLAPQQWQPSPVDRVRTLRPCTQAVGAVSAPICWSVREDLSAWMALPLDSPYPWGQCTYYAGLMRPDVWNDRAPPSIDPPGNWDAWTWAAHARAEGLSVDGHPQPGDLMVYSRTSLGNTTGHLAMVDGVGGGYASPGTVLLTVSEMNVQGLDDPTAGQGDTMTLALPRSEIGPGLIQFIHAPAAGYAPPVWSGGTGAADPGPTPPSAAVDPSLAVAVFGRRLETVSESTAPERAVVTSGTSGRVVARLKLAPNRRVALDLPGGSYRICVAQPASGRWTAASRCATGSWAEHARRSHRAR